MIDWIAYIGAGICFIVGFIGVFFALFACLSWAIDYFIKKWKGYALVIEYALNHQQFKAWKKRND